MCYKGSHFEWDEEAVKHKSESLDGGNNLKIDKAEKPVQKGLEMTKSVWDQLIHLQRTCSTTMKHVTRYLQ